jgi:hypothetical protein
MTIEQRTDSSLICDDNSLPVSLVSFSSELTLLDVRFPRAKFQQVKIAKDMGKSTPAHTTYLELSNELKRKFTSAQNSQKKGGSWLLFWLCLKIFAQLKSSLESKLNSNYSTA